MRPTIRLRTKIFCFLVGATLLISLALIRLVFATELSLLFPDLSCFTQQLSRPVSADILPETIQLYQKAVLEGRGTSNPNFR
ncbi:MULTISPECIES: hypothetical protein [unclassified Anabaena]|uniref:hypothetical protein n=1 Tax=unclassified Anabaena TaxID=2619674 RepID=UPI0012E96CD5|nr:MULTISPECIES: hypothetical protein [unclassified Anabaena]